MAKVSVKIEGVEDLVKKLNGIKMQSTSSLKPIVDNMARSTQSSAKNIIAPHRNKGDLEKSILRASEKTSPTSVRAEVYTYMPYAKFVEFGTKGTWTTSESDPRLDVSKLAKYNGNIPYNALTGRYTFHGQEPKEFMKGAFEATRFSNVYFARYKYLEYILKGIK